MQQIAISHEQEVVGRQHGICQDYTSGSGKTPVNWPPEPPSWKAELNFLHVASHSCVFLSARENSRFDGSSTLQVAGLQLAVNALSSLGVIPFLNSKSSTYDSTGLFLGVLHMATSVF